MKCKTKLPAQWVSLMLEKTDLKKYLFSAKVFIISRFVQICRYLKPRILELRAVAQTHKETILKALFPLVLVLIALYSCTSSQRIVSQNVADIFKISDEIRFQYANKPDYWGLSTQKVLQDKLVSEKFMKGERIYLSGGEEIFIGSGADADVVMPRMSSFDIVLPHLNKAQCISYAESNISADNAVKLLRISIVNASGTHSFEWGGEQYKLPVSQFTSKNFCVNSENTLIWTIQ